MKRNQTVSLGGSCQTYQCQETGAVIWPYGAVSTWAIWCSEVSDGLGLVVRTGQVHWGPSYERRGPEQDEEIKDWCQRLQRLELETASDLTSEIVTSVQRSKRFELWPWRPIQFKTWQENVCEINISFHFYIKLYQIIIRDIWPHCYLYNRLCFVPWNNFIISGIWIKKILKNKTWNSAISLWDEIRGQRLGLSVHSNSTVDVSAFLLQCCSYQVSRCRNNNNNHQFSRIGMMISAEL